MKKILILCLALVLALGSLGLSGALWSDWLYIDGYVYTGDIGAEWSVDYFYDNEAKDYSYIDAWGAGTDTLYIDIGNAYPSVTYTVGWNIECTGSVPIHFDSPWFFGDLPATTDFTFVAFTAAGDPVDLYGYQLHPGEIVYGELTIHLSNDAEQNWFYYFWIELQYGQYNEFP